MAKVGWGRILAGVATVAAAGAAYAYFRQRGAQAPIHETLLTEGAYQIRRYPALLVVETLQNGTRDRALGNGFGLLADYMFGDGREGDEIPITMPVLTAPVADGVWRVRFLIPEGIDRATLEEPGHGIAIAELPARDVAVVSVPGRATDRSFAAKTAELDRWIRSRRLKPSGAAEHGYYNSPLKPGTSHPNEVLIPLAG